MHALKGLALPRASHPARSPWWAHVACVRSSTLEAVPVLFAHAGVTEIKSWWNNLLLLTLCCLFAAHEAFGVDAVDLASASVFFLLDNQNRMLNALQHVEAAREASRALVAATNSVSNWV